MLLGICMMLAFGCKQVNSPLEATSENGQTIEGLNINVKYAESYDQTEITYSRIWPRGISAGFDKSKSTSGGELLVDYERTREVVAYDEEGYMSSVTEFLEGDGEMNMPEQTYKKLKSTMPAKSADYDPIVKIVLQNGVSKSYARSGKLKYENNYNPEEFRVEPALLDVLKTNQEDTSDVELSVQSNIETLEQDGIQFELIDDYYAKYTLPATHQKNVSGLQVVKDLRTGNIVAEAVIRDDGKYQSVSFNKYKGVKGLSVLSYKEKYTYGNLNGKWEITQRTVTHRQNINVIK
jgi:hypothetical protein